MVTIQKVSRLSPRDAIMYFRGKKELWRKLNKGEPIQVPEAVALMCKGVVVKDTVEISSRAKNKAKSAKRSDR